MALGRCWTGDQAVRSTRLETTRTEGHARDHTVTVIRAIERVASRRSTVRWPWYTRSELHIFMAGLGRLEEMFLSPDGLTETSIQIRDPLNTLRLLAEMHQFIPITPADQHSRVCPRSDTRERKRCMPKILLYHTQILMRKRSRTDR